MTATLLLTPPLLLDAHTAQRATIHRNVQAQALAAFGLTEDFNAADEVDRFLEQMFPVITGGQQLTGTTTANYVAQVVSSLTGTPPTVMRIAATAVTALRGVPFATVYSRPFIAAGVALAAGATTAVAWKVGRDRLTRLVDDDLSMAHRAAAREALSSDKRVTGYRRVVRPEGASVCGLCVAASDQRYGREDLMPIHTRCNCGVMPIVRTSFGREKDPGREINGQDIEALYGTATDAAGSTSSDELAAVRFSVHEHGELGPVITRAGDNFTGPADI